MNSQIPPSEMSDFVLSCKNWPWIASHNSMQFALGVTDALHFQRKPNFKYSDQCHRKQQLSLPQLHRNPIFLGILYWPWIGSSHNSMQFSVGVTEAALSKKAQFWIFSQCYRKHNSRELNLIENPIFGGLQNSVHKADGSKFMAHNNDT